MKNARRLPYFMRNKVACPDCGLIVDGMGAARSFDCPRCKAHYSNEDFWEEQYQKWDRTADLSQEVPV